MKFRNETQKNRFGLAVQVAVFVFSLAITVFFLNLPVAGPMIQGDEGSYLANAAAIAGYFNDHANQYYAGYSMFLAPAFLFGGEPSEIWFKVKLINAFLYFITILALFVLSGKLKPDMSIKSRLLSVFLVSLYPMWICMVGYSFSENAFVPGFILVCIAFLSLFGGGKKEWILLGLATGFLFWIHPKSAPVLLAVLLCASYITCLKKNFIEFFLLFVALVLMLVFYKYLFEPWLHSRMTISGFEHSPSYPGITRLLGAIATKDRFMLTLSRFGGHVFYITFATLGLVWVAISSLLSEAFDVSVSIQDSLIKRRASLIFFGVSFFGTLFLSVLFISSPHAVRLDHWMYGRYVEGILAPLLLLGVLNYPKRKSALIFSLLLLLASAFTMKLGLRNYMHTAPFNISAFWQEFFLRDKGLAVWVIAATIPIILLYFLPRRTGTILAIMFFIFCSSQQIKWNVRSSLGARQRWEVSSFVREHFSTETAIGYDRNDLKKYIGNVYWYDFGFQLYDYNLKRVSLDSNSDLLGNAFFSFSRNEALIEQNFFPVALSPNNGPVLWEKLDSSQQLTMDFPIMVRHSPPLLALMLQDGWHGIEKSHVWSKEKSSLLIPIPESYRDKGGRIVISASVFAASENREGRLLFSIDDEEFFAASIKDRSERSFSFPFRPNKKYVKINILIPNATSPIELGSGSDVRVLGVALRSIDIEEPAEIMSRHLLIKSNSEQVEIKPLHNQYALGEPIRFGSQGRNSDFVTFGWSGQEEGHRWTEGARAGLSFTISNTERDKDILLRLRAAAYLGGGLSHQIVEVLANEEKIATWKMADLDWYEAVIPSRLMQNDTLDIVFNISNPTSPSEVGQSSDTRKLGIAARGLIIDKQQ